MRDIVGGRLPALPGLLFVGLLFAGCARNQMLLELRGTVMYEKPRIQTITHAVADAGLDADRVDVAITLLGDAGLTATFDISPGVTERQPMSEVEDGRYEGRFSFARDIFGGPYWVTGRLRHEQAGEHILRDATPLMIAVPSR